MRKRWVQPCRHAAAARLVVADRSDRLNASRLSARE